MQVWGGPKSENCLKIYEKWKTVANYSSKQVNCRRQIIKQSAIGKYEQKIKLGTISAENFLRRITKLNEKRDGMLDKMIEIAKEAGKFLKDNEGKISEIKEKGSFTNLVTNVDKGSETLIKDFIIQNFPGHGILAEESGASLPTSEYRWIIDPLDGTTNYTHAYPVYCVSIGVEYKSEVVAGVVYDPNLDELFSAERGSGAYMNGKRLSVTSVDTLERSLLATGFPYDIKRNPFNCVQHFNEFLVTVQAIRRLGSAALDICYVAAGRLDGFWEVNLHPWDTAAGVLITTEAGGKVTDFTGGKYSIYHRNILLSNGLIHGEMIEVLKRNLKPE